MLLQCAARSMADRVMSSILAGASATNSVRDRRSNAHPDVATLQIIQLAPCPAAVRRDLRVHSRCRQIGRTCPRPCGENSFPHTHIFSTTFPMF